MSAAADLALGERGEPAFDLVEPGSGGRPERALLYQLVEHHYPTFRELRAAADRPLPDFVQQEFDAYLTCGRLEEGFLRVRCEHCHAEKRVAFSCKERGFCPSCVSGLVLQPMDLMARLAAWHQRREARPPDEDPKCTPCSAASSLAGPARARARVQNEGRTALRLQTTDQSDMALVNHSRNIGSSKA